MGFSLFGVVTLNAAPPALGSQDGA